MNGQNGASSFKDEFVVYYSKEDNSWIAHSLRTDQLGFGDCVVDALSDLLVGLHNLIDLAKKGQPIIILNEAPPEIQLIRQTAKILPDCIAQIAIERYYHQLPSEWGVQVNIPHSDSVTVEMSMPLEECPA